MSAPPSSQPFDYLATTPHQRARPTVESFKQDFAAHLRFSLAKDRYTATDRDRFTALALAVRDRVIDRWIQTQQAHHRHYAKRIYYLSLEYLMGRAVLNNLINLGVEELARQALAELGTDLDALLEEEVDAGLGNGGLGRLAACFLDSFATLELPAIGYGLRYDYGIFTQTIRNGYQFERPDDWLRRGNPWLLPRPEHAQPVHFGGRVEPIHGPDGLHFAWRGTHTVMGIPYDMPIVGYRSRTTNTLRLWSAKAAEDFDLHDFNRGDYFGAVEEKVQAEAITKLLYPNDNNYQGKALRFRQQYFFVACSLKDIFRRYFTDRENFAAFPQKVALQLNDTHPAIAVPELMRLLVDEYGLDWDQAWEITTRTTGYTNHTLMPEALETWPVSFFEEMLPRHLMIIEEIDRRFLRRVQTRFPFDEERLSRMSIITPDPEPRVRMAHLAIVGSHSVNGVARLHTELLRTNLFRDFHELDPWKFNNKTNGITPRRWLRVANPRLAALLTERIGDEWLTDLERLRQIEEVADDAFREAFAAIKKGNKLALASLIRREVGVAVDPSSIFDVQVKRIHEYKRQLLNVLNIVRIYVRLKHGLDAQMVPRTFIFAGKAAPGYEMAKRIIKLINAVAEVINGDDTLDDRLRVVFLPNYGVTLAERIIPAADVSQQISTAGMEASGTGNMKFALNGALTVGTLDGANIEIREAVGPEHIFIFGHTAEEVAAVRNDPEMHPRRIYEADEEIRETCDLIFRGFFNREEPGIFDPIRARILDHPDPYLHLADLRMYADAMAATEERYLRPEEWIRSAIRNVARMGRFSSDRTIREYNDEIWKAAPVSPTV